MSMFKIRTQAAGFRPVLIQWLELIQAYQETGTKVIVQNPGLRFDFGCCVQSA